MNHQGQFPVITLSFNLAPRTSLGEAMNAVSRVKDELQLPASFQAEFQGTAAAFQASLANEPVLILAELKTDAGATTAEQDRWLSLLRAVPGVRVRLWRPALWPAVVAELTAA